MKTIKAIAFITMASLTAATCRAQNTSNDMTLIGKVYLGVVQEKLDSPKILMVNIGIDRLATLFCADSLTGTLSKDLIIIRQPDLTSTVDASDKYQSFKIGDKVLVQVFKCDAPDSPIRVTTNLFLRSEGMALLYPVTGIGVSQYCNDQIRQWARQAEIPNNCGLIVRKDAALSTADALNTQLSGLVKKMNVILQGTQNDVPPALLGQ
jgi:Ribonuclease G/E